MNRLYVARYSRVVLALFLLNLGPICARAATITASGSTNPLTADIPSPFEGLNTYRFNLGTYFPGSPNPLPQGMFTENEFNTNLVLFGGGFGTNGPDRSSRTKWSSSWSLATTGSII